VSRRRRTTRGRPYKRGRIWWISYYHEGRNIRSSSRSTKKAVARQLLNERIALLRPDPGMSNVRLSELLDALAADYEINQRPSIDRLRVSIKHLRAHFGDPLAREISSEDVVSYSTERHRARAGNGTINVELGALRRAFRLGQQRDRIAKVPRISLLKPPPARAGFVEREQLELILAALPAEMRPLVLTAFITGWRMRSELLTRTWRHVDFAGEGWLSLDPGEGKTGKGRTFPFTDELRAVLTAQLTRAAEIALRTGRAPATVFFGAEGRPLRGVRAAWLQAVAAAGCPGLRPHDLRRSAVREFERAGVARSTSMEYTGHRSQSVFDRYAISDSKSLREGAEKLNRSRAQSGHSPSEASTVIGNAASPENTVEGA
jgi:integrase